MRSFLFSRAAPSLLAASLILVFVAVSSAYACPNVRLAVAAAMESPMNGGMGKDSPCMPDALSCDDLRLKLLSHPDKMRVTPPASTTYSFGAGQLVLRVDLPKKILAPAVARSSYRLFVEFPLYLSDHALLI